MSGKAIFKLINKNGANIGESNYGNIKFSINIEFYGQMGLLNKI